MAYSELIKNFEKIRAYMREFYVYGFKSRKEYNTKSARSYDDERRRIESWLGDYMRFTQTPDGKNVFLSVDSRITQRNPFYKAWKAKSFTDKDITLHFVIFDILSSPQIKKTLSEIVNEIDERIFSSMNFDESTVRKKLKEYGEEGIIKTLKIGRRVFYSRADDENIFALRDALDFFSEVSPCGVIGSFLLDKFLPHDSLFSFKHHYITQAMDSDIMAILFNAISEKRYVTIDNLSRSSNKVKTIRLVPLKIYISVQNGRQNLIAFNEEFNRISSYRLDHISNVKISDKCDKFDKLRENLNRLEQYMWGVNCASDMNHLEHVEFVVKIDRGEQYIINRLQREKRCGRVEKLDDFNYRYSADVFDTLEMIPWIRTFISRITSLKFSNVVAENQFKAGIEEMYSMYGIGDDGGNDI